MRFSQFTTSYVTSLSVLTIYIQLVRVDKKKNEKSIFAFEAFINDDDEDDDDENKYI